jgi:hypothetical protein
MTAKSPTARSLASAYWSKNSWPADVIDAEMSMTSASGAGAGGARGVAGAGGAPRRAAATAAAAVARVRASSARSASALAASRSRPMYPSSMMAGGTTTHQAAIPVTASAPDPMASTSSK